MNKANQFQHHLHTFMRSFHNWNPVDGGLTLLATGLFLLAVGETLRVRLNLIVGIVTCWCGILFIYLSVAVFTAVLKVLLDDAFGTDDY